MNIQLRDLFIQLWTKYFGSSELPIVFFYSDQMHEAEVAPVPKGHSCMICELSKVRNGQSLYFTEESIACGGGKRYSGYSTAMLPTFRYFLSCGIEGKVRGERYKRSPEIVDQTMEQYEKITAKGKNLVFKRWDKLTSEDQPEVVILFAQPEVLSGWFTLANFDQIDPNGVYTPFAAGCGSIIYFPMLEKKNSNPRCVIGMFDPSARPCVPVNTLTFATTYERFMQLVGYMEESFLITPTWDRVKKRFDPK